MSVGRDEVGMPLTRPRRHQLRHLREAAERFLVSAIAALNAGSLAMSLSDWSRTSSISSFFSLPFASLLKPASSMMRAAFADSPTAASCCLIWVVVTFIEMKTERATSASQPNTAVFQWLALQRPIRAARFCDCFSGDTTFLLSDLRLQIEGLAVDGAEGDAPGRCERERVVVGGQGVGPVDVQLEVVVALRVGDRDLHGVGRGRPEEGDREPVAVAGRQLLPLGRVGCAWR